MKIVLSYEDAADLISEALQARGHALTGTVEFTEENVLVGASGSDASNFSTEIATGYEEKTPFLLDEGEE